MNNSRRAATSSNSSRAKCKFRGGGTCKETGHLSSVPNSKLKGHIIPPLSSQLYPTCPRSVFCRTLLWLSIVCVVVAGGAVAESIESSSCKHYPDPVEYAMVTPPFSSRSGGYPNGSRAHVECYSNFRVKYADSLTCINGEWMSSGGRPVECELTHPTGATTCGAHPSIERGFYNMAPDDTSGMGNPNTERAYHIGAELLAECIPTYTLNCTHPHHYVCGRISCQDGRWVPKDGNLITACVAKPVTLTVNGDDERHTPRSPSLKNYLILALALVCIFVVGALTVALLRRPLFCKKRGQQQGDGPVVITSASPNHQGGGSDLDSLPVAMNTGIFLPGAGYDLQDCQMQDVTFVGTSVFK